MQQLANTSIGDALAGDATKLPDKLRGIAAQFERYAEGASELFKRRAGIYAVFAGIGLAALLNVDGFTLAKRLFEDQSLAEQTIVTLSREQLQKYVDQAGSDKDAQVRIDDAKVELTKIGLPVGDRYFPRCGTAADGTFIDSRCPAWKTGWEPANEPAWLMWILSLVVTGALLGLGAPFWFDIYKYLAGFAGFSGMGAAALKAVQGGGKAGDGTAVPPPAVVKLDLVQIFTDARLGRPPKT